MTAKIIMDEDDGLTRVFQPRSIQADDTRVIATAFFDEVKEKRYRFNPYLKKDRPSSRQVRLPNDIAGFKNNTQLDIRFFNYTNQPVLVKSQFGVVTTIQPEPHLKTSKNIFEIYVNVFKHEERTYDCYTLTMTELNENAREGIYIEELQLLVGLSINSTMHPKTFELYELIEAVGKRYHSMLDEQNIAIQIFISCSNGPEIYYMNVGGISIQTTNLAFNSYYKNDPMIIINSFSNGPKTYRREIEDVNVDSAFLMIENIPVVYGSDREKVEAKARELSLSSGKVDPSLYMRKVEHEYALQEANNKLHEVESKLRDAIEKTQKENKLLSETIEELIKERDRVTDLYETVKKMNDDYNKAKVNESKTKIAESSVEKESLSLSTQAIKYSLFVGTTVVGLFAVKKVFT